MQSDGKFPKRFLWGAAVAAHQVEGGTHNQWTEWELENARALASQAEYQLSELPAWDSIKNIAKNPANYVSATASDHFNRYLEDFDILKKLNMNAFRFSIEWSRLEPEEGAWDAEAIEHYKRYVVELKKREIEPIVTLFHFTLPVWFTKKGGFEKRNNIKYFVRYAEKILTELGLNVKYVITINEPEVYAIQGYHEGRWPPGVQSKRRTWLVLNNLARAHNQAAKMIHGLGRRYEVSIAKNTNYVYAGDDALISRTSASIAQYFSDDYFLNKVVKNCDFIGMNYYFSNRIYGYRVHNPEEKTTDLGWDASPDNIQFAVERLYEKYNLPIMITENGVADMNDELRKWWIQHTIVALKLSLQRGVPIIGYMHWSLLDNFEWSYGKWPRFGLVHVNYRTFERTIRPSAKWFAGVLKKVRP